MLQLAGLSLTELRLLVAEFDEPRFRADQIFNALHKRRVQTIREITELPLKLRNLLAERATATSLKIESRYISQDSTRRYLLRTYDNRPVETVFIPEEHRDTICFSSQSGCPLQCSFCLTAKLGLLRSLTPGEIVEQIIIVLNDAYGPGVNIPRRTNLVGMGAGEPFLAFDSLMKALTIIAEPQGLHIAQRRVTVSTAGVVPRILELAGFNQRPQLAVSLAAADPALRDVLMPINKRWPLPELLSACQVFERSLRRRERFTFEYVMLDAVNDSDEQARQLGNLLNKYQLRAKVNLIPHNPAEPLPYSPSPSARVERFRATLKLKGIDSFVRRPRGRDIYAACGQLAAKDLTSGH